MLAVDHKPSVATGAPHPDAKLLVLRAKLEVAWKAERAQIHAPDPQFQAAYNRSSRLVERMAKIEATTLTGLQAKAFAVLWCRGDEDEDILVNDYGTTDLKLAAGLIRDLLAIPPA